MASYGYVAINQAGKTIKGTLDVDSLDKAKNDLKQQGLTLVEIKEETLLTKEISLEIGGFPTPRELSVFCRQFVSMTKAGVPMVAALKMLQEQTENKRLRAAVEGVRVNVEKGETLANSLAKYPKIFPSLLVSMVEAGESSGSLDIAIERMASQFEKSAKTTALVKKAMIYPIIVCIVAIAVVIVMLVVVIPNYTSMFADLGTDLPGITKAVAAASDFIITKWFILLPVVIALVIVLKTFFSTDLGKHISHAVQLKFPATRNLVVKQASSQVARTMSTLLAAGVPLAEAVEIVGNTMQNVYFREGMEQCKKDITVGRPFSYALEDTNLFPPMVYHMTRIGEESGNTEEMLSTLADYYDEEVEMAVQSLMAAMEPMIIVVLAGIVLVLVGACMAPMLTMYQSLENL